MQISPYLSFNGNCAEAFKFYEQVLGGSILFSTTYGQNSGMGMPVSPEMNDKIIHIRLAVGDQVIQGADAPPEYYSQPQGYSVTLALEDTAQAEKIFNAFADGGQVRMPFGETFWARGFGMVIDRFGTPWMINAGEKPM